MWFDAQELGGILKWIRRGGERLQRFKIELPAIPQGRPGIRGMRGSSKPDGLRELLSNLFDL